MLEATGRPALLLAVKLEAPVEFLASEAQTSEQTICSPSLLLPLDFNSTLMNSIGPSPRGSYESTFAPAPGMQHPDCQVLPPAQPPSCLQGYMMTRKHCAARPCWSHA